MQNLPGPGIEPVFNWQAGFSTTGPPGKCSYCFLRMFFQLPAALYKENASFSKALQSVA